MIQVLSVVFCFLFVGYLVFFCFQAFSTWRGLRPFLASVLHIAVMLAFLFPFPLIRKDYTSRVATVMLTYVRCPHCGYDIRGLPRSSEDGATVCPECGCAWMLNDDR